MEGKGRGQEEKKGKGKEGKNREGGKRREGVPIEIKAPLTKILNMPLNAPQHLRFSDDSLALHVTDAMVCNAMS